MILQLDDIPWEGSLNQRVVVHMKEEIRLSEVQSKGCGQALLHRFEGFETHDDQRPVHLNNTTSLDQPFSKTFKD
jgi:hypothetical protein